MSHAVIIDLPVVNDKSSSNERFKSLAEQRLCELSVLGTLIGLEGDTLSEQTKIWMICKVVEIQSDYMNNT